MMYATAADISRISFGSSLFCVGSLGAAASLACTAGVLRWFSWRICKGLLEAANSLIQSAKAKARGFRSTRFPITMVYLTAGKLDFKLPAIAQVTHTK